MKTIIVSLTINCKEMKFEIEVDQYATDEEIDETVKEEVANLFCVEWEED